MGAAKEDQSEWERNAVDCHTNKFQSEIHNYAKYENELTGLEAEDIEIDGLGGR